MTATRRYREAWLAAILVLGLLSVYFVYTLGSGAESAQAEPPMRTEYVRISNEFASTDGVLHTATQGIRSR